MKKALSALTLSMFVTPALAQLSEQAGFSGEISLNAGYTTSTSNFNTSGDKTIDSVNQDPEQENGFLAAPLGNLAYTFGESLNQQVYAGMSREDIAVGTLALEVGYKYQLGSGTIIDVSLLPTVMSGETWEDPFLTGSRRSTTEERGNAFRLKLSNIFTPGFNLDMAYATKDIEDEASGTSNSELQDGEEKLLERDSHSYYLKGSYRLPLDRTTFLQPSVTYIKTEADGEANSLTSLGGEISLFKVINRHQFALTAGYTNRAYDKQNPLYDKTRDENQLSLFAAYEYQHFMGWQDWSLIGLAGYGANNANIGFYDNQESLLSVGINYHF
ncbi:DUF2860 domain-containing protein [Vibrio sinaloensis]|uniref:DUF2860 domain-containing protein n=1 Tax=Photobacterium sp. (strain ATCC 43367) TaxID=379097 RepID=UPI0035E86100